MRRVLILFSCAMFSGVPVRAQFELVDAFPGHAFTFPVDIAGAGDNRVFVVQKSGLVRVIDDGVSHLFIDLSSRLTTFSESGALGIAFAPDFATTGHVYLSFTEATPHRFVVARFTVSPTDSNALEPSSELSIMTIDRTAFNHNGGQLAFRGNEPCLYISTGDNATQALAQDRTNLHGSILKIDPRIPEGANNYTIPEDNPFYGMTDGTREEIWAYGFRNPWRMSFDKVRGTLWVGDVGQNSTEEIDRVTEGRNYGWPLMEGSECFDPWWCDTTGVDARLPYHEYDHTLGVAVIGGRVYRGTGVWSLIGYYVFSDYVGGRVWAFNVDNETTPPVIIDVVTGAPSILCIGEDSSGELLFGSGDGKVYRLVQTLAVQAPPVAASALGAPYPNPFNPSVTIPLTLARPSRVLLTIHRATGERVRTILDGPAGPELRSVAWDGTDDRGRRVASGIYMAVLNVDGATITSQRLVLIK